MKLIELNAYRSYSLYLMEGSDFSYVKAFLDGQREKLERIEFFYPYTDKELRNVLENGYFVGLFDGEDMIATFAIDGDEEYADELARIIKSCSGVDVGKAYESSGLMVDASRRGEGVAGFLTDEIVRRADSRAIAVCGVVHIENTASIATFFSRGFELSGVWCMSEGYDFVYLLRRAGGNAKNSEIKSTLLLQNNGDCDKIKIDTEYSPIGDLDRHRKLLDDGYRGILIKGSRIVFAREKKGGIYE